MEMANYMITEPAALMGFISINMSPACFGDLTGVLEVEGFGGTPPYGYLWSTGSSAQVVTGLMAGNYSVTVSDANGCTIASSEELTQPAQILPNAIATGESAPGAMDGTASANPTGGTGNYTYLWTNGATTAMIGGLAVGAYTVTVTDDIGCTAMQSVVVTGVNCALGAAVTGTDALCSGESGTAQVMIEGALGTVELQWSNGDTVPLIMALQAGMYSVTVTDSAGCIAISDVTIGEPAMLNSTCIAVGETMEGSNDGSITCTPFGGVPPYLFLWSNGDTSGMITGLSPGTYFVTVTDDNGCMHIDTAVVNTFNCALQLNIIAEDVTCFGESNGAASVMITGGSGPYEIQWSSGDTGMDIDSLPAGAFSVTVTDADSCLVELPFEIDEPSAISVTVDTVIHATQSGGGAIQITISGGTPPYTTIWTKDGGLVSTNEDPDNLPEGNYQLEIIDAHDCMLTAGTVTVTVLSGLEDGPDETGIRLWPNPGTAQVTLQVGKDYGHWTGALYAADGRLVLVFGAGDFTNGTDIHLDTEALQAGLYYLAIAGAQGQSVIPFVKLDE
jgi:hypothetical protein